MAAGERTFRGQDSTLSGRRVAGSRLRPALAVSTAVILSTAHGRQPAGRFFVPRFSNRKEIPAGSPGGA